MHLLQMGWRAFFQNHWEQAKNLEKRLLNPFCVPGRVIRLSSGHWTVVTESGTWDCELSGRLSYGVTAPEQQPAIGDWVIARPWSPEDTRGFIEWVLPRDSRLQRIVAGDRSDVQLIAANLDVVFIVSSLNEELNLNRIERYVFLCRESNIPCALVLSKADLCRDTTAIMAAIVERLPQLEIILTSSATGQGTDAIRAKLPFGTTGTFVGSSGVGKSTLLNAISGRQQMATQSISFDAKGKHTTTHRELCFIGPEHGMIIDTPGMREIQLPVSDAAFDDLFSDIIDLGNRCFYRDCSHQAEPNCAINSALAAEQLAPERWKQYQKMLAEQAYQRRRENKVEELAEKQKWKRIHKQLRQKKPL